MDVIYNNFSEKVQHFKFKQTNKKILKVLAIGILRRSYTLSNEKQEHLKHEKKQKSKNERGSSLKKDGSKSFFKAKCDFYWATGQ